MKFSALKKALYSVSWALLYIVLSSNSAYAAGLYVQEVSSSAAGAANAGAAAMARDASIIFHNPSAMTQLSGAQINGGVHALFTHSDLEDRGSRFAGAATSANGLNSDGGNPGGWKAIPNLYAAAPIDDAKSLWLGVGVTAPWGLGPDYDASFFVSQLITQAELSVIDITPSVAFKVNDALSLGLSAIIQKAHLDYRFIANPGAPDVETRVVADDFAHGFKASATFTPNDDWTIGLQYRSATNLDFSGTIDSNVVAGTHAVGTLNLPDMVTASLAYDIDDQWTLMGGMEWFGWNNTDVATIKTTTPGDTELPVQFLYENTLNLSLGVEHRYDDNWTLRAGYQYDETPTTLQARSPLNPDGNRHWFAAGATQKLDDKWSLDYAVTYITISDGTMNRTGLSGGGQVVGAATDQYSVIGTFGVNYKF